MTVRFTQVTRLDNNQVLRLQRQINQNLQQQLDKIRKQIWLWLSLGVKEKWGPLKPEYSPEGLEQPSPKYLLDPQEYLECFSVESTSVPFLSLVFTIKPGIHEPSGWSWEELVLLREYGSARLGVPAAPVLRPLWTRIKTQLGRFNISLSGASDELRRPIV